MKLKKRDLVACKANLYNYNAISINDIPPAPVGLM